MPALLEGLQNLVKYALWRKAHLYKDYLAGKNTSSGMGLESTKSGVNDSYS